MPIQSYVVGQLVKLVVKLFKENRRLKALIKNAKGIYVKRSGFSLKSLKNLRGFQKTVEIGSYGLEGNFKRVSIDKLIKVKQLQAKQQRAARQVNQIAKDLGFHRKVETSFDTGLLSKSEKQLDKLLKQRLGAFESKFDILAKDRWIATLNEKQRLVELTNRTGSPLTNDEKLEYSQYIENSKKPRLAKQQLAKIKNSLISRYKAIKMV